MDFEKKIWVLVCTELRYQGHSKLQRFSVQTLGIREQSKIQNYRTIQELGILGIFWKLEDMDYLDFKVCLDLGINLKYWNIE